jgi:deoxycytidylate deaminase
MSDNFNKYIQIYNELKALNTDKPNLKFFFDKAEDAAESSTCGRRKVGAVIAYWPEDPKKVLHKNGKILGIGYNGYKERGDETRYGLSLEEPTATCAHKFSLLKIDPESPDGSAMHLILMKEEIHAEDRAIQNVIRKYGEDILSDCIIFTTLSPCADCMAMINKYDIALGGYIEKYKRDGGAGLKGMKKLLLNNEIREF